VNTRDSSKNDFFCVKCMNRIEEFNLFSSTSQ
jgi:hypothetical protein